MIYVLLPSSYKKIILATFPFSHPNFLNTLQNTRFQWSTFSLNPVTDWAWTWPSDWTCSTIRPCFDGTNACKTPFQATLLYWRSNSGTSLSHNWLKIPYIHNSHCITLEEVLTGKNFSHVYFDVIWIIFNWNIELAKIRSNSLGHIRFHWENSFSTRGPTFIY